MYMKTKHVTEMCTRTYEGSILSQSLGFLTVDCKDKYVVGRMTKVGRRPARQASLEAAGLPEGGQLVDSSDYTGFLLDQRSLPPDFASRCVKSLALVLTRYLQAFCAITDHFRQILPADV